MKLTLPKISETWAHFDEKGPVASFEIKKKGNLNGLCGYFSDRYMNGDKESLMVPINNLFKTMLDGKFQKIL